MAADSMGKLRIYLRPQYRIRIYKLLYSALTAVDRRQYTQMPVPSNTLATSMMTLVSMPVSVNWGCATVEPEPDPPELVGVPVPAPEPLPLAELFNVSLFVVMLPPKARARPVHVALLLTVMPDASMSVPTKVEFAPRVVAAPGVHQMSLANAPPASATTELADVVKAPVILNVYEPAPVSVMVPPPAIEAVPVIQYTPGAYTPAVP